MSITTIILTWKRPQNLIPQLESIKNQTVSSDQIWLWINNSTRSDEIYEISKDQQCINSIFKSSKNFGCGARFNIGLLAETEYISFLDDDTIIGARWYENCLNTMSQQEGIFGSAGVILQSSEYDPHIRCGWPTQNHFTTRVDLVGHSIFMKSKWLRYYYYDDFPIGTNGNGEDIRLAYMCQKYGNINCYCPIHPENDLSLHGSIHPYLGLDQEAMSQTCNHNTFFPQRNACVHHALKHGWSTIINEIK